MTEPINVFISSTWIDMIREREAVELASKRLRSIHFVGMEYFGARSHTTREVSLEEVDRCQVYVGVLGHRWGSGITEAEYRRAIERALDCLIYQKVQAEGEHPQTAEDTERQAAWRRELTERHTVAQFDTAPELAARVVADLHNLLFDKLVVMGLGQLHEDYDTRIQRFIAEYLGTRAAPVPFGGRRDELDALDRWLADPQGAPYALVAGPAGRGKSALLVHWVRSLAAQEDLSLIYFPISVRFRTNLASIAYASIAARLAALHGESLPATPDTPLEVLREMMATLLRRPPPPGQRFLLVLDGADEAADWELGPDIFAASPPPGLRVLVSARTLAGDVDAQGWAARLGWDRPRLANLVDLPPLSASGLADVLAQASLPLQTLGAQADMVAALFRLSGGDPLVANLYIADLWARGDDAARLRPEDLDALQPGLDGYFRRWWDDQRALWGDEGMLREPAVNAVLDVLSCALGPLQTAELLELLPADRGLAVWALDDTLRCLARFVIGDGDAQGYAFSHPRLAEYFYGRLAKARQQHAQEMRFVAWGRACLADLMAGRRATETTPGYLLRFLRLHFDRARCPAADYRPLASTAWLRAWRRIDRGSYGGFLADLRGAADAAVRANDEAVGRGEPTPELGMEIRAALCLSSIATEAADMSVSLLRALCTTGIWSLAQAIAYVTRVPDARERLHGLLALVAAADAADRPLALAAGLTALRGLFDREGGRGILRDVLRGVAEDGGVHAGPEMAAALFEAMGALIRQGVSPVQQAEVLAAMRQATTESRACPEQRAMLWAALAKLSDDPELRSQALGKAESMANQRGHTALRWPGARLRLLQQRRDAGEPERWAAAALDAAMQTLSVAIASGAEQRPEAIRTLFAAWRSGSADAVETTQRLVLPRLSAQQHEVLFDAAADLPRTEQLAHVPSMLRVCRALAAGSSPGLVRAVEGLLESGRPTLDGDLSWFLFLTDPALIERGVQAAIADLPLDAGLAVCINVAERCSDPALRARLAAAALAAIDVFCAQPDPGAGSWCLRLAGAAIGVLQPKGSDDSLEAWRWLDVQPDGEGVSRRSTKRAFTTVLASADVPKARLWGSIRGLIVAGQHLVRTPHDGALRARIAAVDRLMAPSPPEDRVPGSAVMALLVYRHSPEALAAAIVGAVSPASLVASLSLLASTSGVISDRVLRHAVPHILRHAAWGDGYESVPAGELVTVLTLVAKEPLWPPDDETIAALPDLVAVLWAHPGLPYADRMSLLGATPMPDLIREMVISVALAAAEKPAVDQRLTVSEAEIVKATAALDEIPCDLMLRAAAAVRRTVRLDQAVRNNCLLSLAPGLRRDALAGWLEAAVGFHAMAGARFHLVTGDLLDAIGTIPPPQRCWWLIALADTWTPDHLGPALAMAGALPGPNDRLRAWCALLPRALPTERAGTLASALRLTRVCEPDSAITRTLIQMAVDLGLDSAGLRDAATAAVAAIADRALRSEALAALIPLLPAAEAEALVAASRHVGDTAARVVSVRLLLEVCASPSAAAVDRILNTLRAEPDAGVRAASQLVLAPALPPPVRWAVLGQALQIPATRSGFDMDDLFNALVPALADAPMRTMAAALGWARRCPAWTGRSEMLVRLIPDLPADLRLQAVIQAGQDACILARLAPWVGRQEVAAARKAPGLSRPAQDWLSRLAARQAEDTAAFIEVVGEDVPSVMALLAGADWDGTRAAVARRLALSRQLTDAERLGLAENVAAIGYTTLRYDAARYLAVLCAAPSLPRALDWVGAITMPADRARLQVRLAARHTGRVRDRILDQAMTSAAAEPEARRRVGAVVACVLAAPHLLEVALALVAGTGDGTLRMAALSMLLTRLPDRVAAGAAGRAAQLLDEPSFVQMAVEAAPGGGPLTAFAVLDVAVGLARPVSRARVLAAWAPRLPDSAKDQALAIIEGLSVDFAWLDGLAALALRWPEMLSSARAEQAAEVLVEIADPSLTFRWLQAIAPVWPGEVWHAFTAALRVLRDQGAVAALLALAIGHCRAPVHPNLLDAVRAIAEPGLRSVLLGRAALVERDAMLLDDAIRDTGRVSSSERRISALAVMVSAGTAVPHGVFAALLDESRDHPRPALQAFRDVAPKLGPDQADALLDQLPWEGWRGLSAECADLLARLAPRCAGLTRLLQAAGALCTPRDMARLIGQIAGQPNPHGEELLTAALALPAGTPRAQALLEIASILEEMQQRRALAALVDTPSHAERARRLAVIRPSLTGAAVEDWTAATGQLWPAALRDRVLTRAAPSPASPADAVGQAADRQIAALLTELPRAAAPFPVEPPPAAPRVVGTASLLTQLGALESPADRLQLVRHSLPALSSRDRAALLAALGDLLPPALYDEAVPLVAVGLEGNDRQALIAALQPIDHPARLTPVLSACSAILDVSLRSALLTAFRDALRRAASGSRPDAVAVLGAWAPAIVVLGGDAAAVDAIDAIVEAGELWP